MQVYLIQTETEGEVTKEPGRTSTEITTNQYRIAAESFEEAYTSHIVQDILKRPDIETLKTIHEEHPSIIILPQHKLDQI